MVIRESYRAVGNGFQTGGATTVRAVADIAFPTGYERGLPPLALHSLRQRRRRLVSLARGRVLDLGGCDAHPDLYRDVSSVVMLPTREEGGQRLRRRAAGAAVAVEVSDVTPAQLVAVGDRFDTIVSVLQLSLLEHLGPTLRALATLLGDDGMLLFLEPTAAGGFTVQAQRLLATPARLVTGRRPHRDVPAMLRAGGLVVTDLDRFSLNLPWPYRSFVQGVARRPSV